jgi:glycyl-tRNA synthetase beta chain
MTGAFEPRFLEIPHGVIVSAIQTHLRGFPIFEGPGKVTSRFAFIANRPPDAVIREGNERVVRARLSDASFFYETDMKSPLVELAPKLKDVVFQDGLGTFWDKQERVGKIAVAIAERIGLAGKKGEIERAASLMKADLLTQVVGEFPELQGEVGAVYAKKQGEPADVASAIREAYLPKGEGDALPESQVGICLSLAEKADNAACAFAVNMKPTGSKDPLGVRRQVIGMLRILRERGLAIGVSQLFELATARLPDEVLRPKEKKKDKEKDAKAEPPPAPDVVRKKIHGELVEFARTRLAVMASPEDGGAARDLVQAVFASAVDEVPDFWSRLEAITALAARAEFAKLVELVERTKNITKKEKDIPARVDASLLREAEEKALAQALDSVRAAVADHLERRQYAEAGRRYMDALSEPVARFFEKVFVNDPDARLKSNRLALLRDVHALLAERFADLAEVARKR